MTNKPSKELQEKIDRWNKLNEDAESIVDELRGIATKIKELIEAETVVKVGDWVSTSLSLKRWSPAEDIQAQVTEVRARISTPYWSSNPIEDANSLIAVYGSRKLKSGTLSKDRYRFRKFEIISDQDVKIADAEKKKAAARRKLAAAAKELGVDVSDALKA